MASSKKRLSRKDREALGYNPKRTADLFALTADGYIIAQDVVCQNEYVDEQRCPHCGASKRMIAIASINRSFQGLNEMVAICRQCGEHTSYIFDISNEVFQAWFAQRMGELYSRAYDGPPRVADPNHKRKE